MQFEFGQPQLPPKSNEVQYFFNRKSEISVFYTFTAYKTLTEDDAKKDKDFAKLFQVPSFCSL